MTESESYVVPDYISAGHSYFLKSCQAAGGGRGSLVSGCGTQTWAALIFAFKYQTNKRVKWQTIVLSAWQHAGGISECIHVTGDADSLCSARGGRLTDMLLNSHHYLYHLQLFLYSKISRLIKSSLSFEDVQFIYRRPLPALCFVVPSCICWCHLTQLWVVLKYVKSTSSTLAFNHICSLRTILSPLLIHRNVFFLNWFCKVWL